MEAHKFKYRFKPSRETLEELSKLSPEMRLKWLEEANRFIYKFVGEDKRKRWHTLHKGIS